MAAFVKEQGIDYPVAADVGAKTVAAFKVDSFPDYYVIDRSGKLRFADLANAELERAITTLLGESAPPAGETTPWSEALADAAKRRKRVLASTLDKAAQAELGAVLKTNRELARSLSYEYVRYDLQRGDEPAPAGHPQALAETAAALVVFDEKGAELARVPWADLHDDRGLSAARLQDFLAKNARPHPDAEKHFAAALARARAEDKRLLVHLGAPW